MHGNAVFVTLPIGGPWQAPFFLNALQVQILALPGGNVLIRRTVFLGTTAQQLAAHRPSYINAILIQRAGQLVPGGCLECQRRGAFPFHECRRTPGHFGGACGACKWRDHAARCSQRDANQPDSSDSDSDDEEPLLSSSEGPSDDGEPSDEGEGEEPEELDGSDSSSSSDEGEFFDISEN
jgi:hypothetical protein